MAQHKVRRRLYFALSLNVPFVLFTLGMFVSTFYLHKSQESMPVTIDIRGNYTETMNFLHYPIYAASAVTWTEGNVTARIDLETDGLGICDSNVPHLAFEAVFYDENTLRITLRDADAERWEPDAIPNQRKYWYNNYDLELEEYPFAFKVVRKQSDSVIFDSRGKNSSPTLCYTDKYIEFSSRTVPSPLIYGLGERIAPFPLRTDGRNYTIWPNSQVNISDSGIDSKGLHGHHPFYMEMQRGKTHGVFLHNSNALEVEFGSEKVTFRTTGGIIDLFIFLGSGPDEVVQQYQGIVGKPMLPPYWALGFHQAVQCESAGQLREVIRKHHENNIPLDAIWLDRSCVASAFSIAHFQPSEMSELSQDLKTAGIKVVPWLTPDIEESADTPYTRGQELHVFLSSSTREPIVFHTPTKNVSYVDFFHPNATTYWCEMLDRLNSQLEYSGIWLEENEVTIDPALTEPVFAETSFETPFTPDGISLDYNMLPLRLQHYGGRLNTEFNTHSLYGSMSSRATADCITQHKSIRPLVTSRSTRAGDGSHIGHLLSGTHASWEQLRASLVSVFNYQMYGLGISGTDICGHRQEGADELCTRWVQLAAWFPLFRNNHEQNTPSHMVFSWAKDLQSAIKSAIQLRYTLATYLYSTLFSVSLKGGSIIRPLFFEYPHEESLYRDDSHVMIGPAFLLTPIITENIHESLMSLPLGSLWYNYFTGEKIAGRENLRFFTGLDSISLLVKAGTVVTYQDANGVTNLEGMRNRTLGVLFALDDQRQGKGDLYLDDGISPNSLTSKRYLHVFFHAFKEEFSLVIDILPRFKGYTSDLRLTELKIYGLHLRVVEEVTVNSATPTDLMRLHNFVYNESKGTLEVSLDLDLAFLHRLRIS